MEQKNIISRLTANSLPAMVRNELENLSPQKQAEFLEEYRRKTKSLSVAYVAWFFLGWHYAFLGKWGAQFLFWITCGGIAVWWVIDLFRIPGMIRDHNKDIAINILKNLKTISS